MATEIVNVDNFTRAESDRMFARFAADAGGVNRWLHNRVPTPLDHQPVIRQNRDTLYSATVVDATEGFDLELPDAGERYLSAMVVDQDHYIAALFHEPGRHHLGPEQIGTDHVTVALRILVDPDDPADVAEVNALQDQVGLEAASDQAFVHPAYDGASLDSTRNALLELAKGMHGFERTFGRPEQVDAVRHLIGTAAGWGGLPETEAIYLNVNPDLPVADHTLVVGDVPVDAFWSISVYNGAGYFEQGLPGANSINSVSAEKAPDGSTTVHFGGGTPEHPNHLSIMDGWNYCVRLYRPRAEIHDGSWTFPTIDSGA